MGGWGGKLPLASTIPAPARAPVPSLPAEISMVPSLRRAEAAPARAWSMFPADTHVPLAGNWLIVPRMTSAPASPKMIDEALHSSLCVLDIVHSFRRDVRAEIACRHSVEWRAAFSNQL